MPYTAKIQQIGNSKCVIIPAVMLRQLAWDVEKDVQLEVKDGALLISQPKKRALRKHT